MINTIFKILVSVVAIIIAIIHLLSPGLSIDVITLGLFIIALAPWLGQIFKSLEFPGGWKIEYQDLQKVKDDVKKAGLLAEKKVKEKKEFVFQGIASEDPNLALAGLRIEIEKRLVNIAQSYNIYDNKMGVGRLLRELSYKDILTQEESSSLSDMVNLLNSAVHGAKVDKNASEWALDLGSKILASLDEKVKKLNAHPTSGSSRLGKAAAKIK